MRQFHLNDNNKKNRINQNPLAHKFVFASLQNVKKLSVMNISAKLSPLTGSAYLYIIT